MPLERGGPAPMVGSVSIGLTAPPWLTAEDWIFNEGAAGPRAAEACELVGAAAASAAPVAARDGAGPTAREIRGVCVVAVADGWPVAVVRGRPDRATTWVDPTANSATPAAAVLSLAGGPAAERRTAASEAVGSRLAVVPPAAAGVTAGSVSIAMAVDGMLAPRAERASVVGLAGAASEPAGCCCTAVSRREAIAEGS